MTVLSPLVLDSPDSGSHPLREWSAVKIERFEAGTYRQQYHYKSFSPAPINHDWSWEDPRLNVLLEQATRELGELNALTGVLPGIDRFIRMHIVKEANTSSRIEGTRTEFDEVLLEEEEIEPERRDDWREVQNYIRAMNRAVAELQRLPLCMRLLKVTHEELMQGVRGERKTPGEFRRSQNWIGGASLADAVFIPPHHEELPGLLGDLEAFWHNESIQVPHLIRCAISHYQFETIHPFLDGNGRIGRLLITLYLVSHGTLAKPSLYLSSHLEQHRAAYFDALSRVRESNDLGHWCRFFLQAVVETARSGKTTLQRIVELRDEVEAQTVTLGRRAENARRLVMHLYEEPAITIRKAARMLEIEQSTASRLVSSLVEMGILREMTGYRRNRIFLFSRYVAIFSGKEPA